MLHAERHTYDDYTALAEDYDARGWTDGLPIVPPTPEAVESFLEAASLAPDAVLGEVPTREVIVTAEHAAINAVMAGCRPAYFPTVAAAVRAHLHEKGNCHSTTGTLSGASQIVVVNGPVRDEIELECGEGCFGPGFRANATIGRALRLVIRNVCRAIPGYLDRASFASPFRYSFCFGENEGASDWTPLHVARGFDANESAVTVHSAMNVSEVADFESRTPEALCDVWLEELLRKGVYADRFLQHGTILIVMGPEHQRFFLEAGWTKEQNCERLFEKSRNPGPGQRPVSVAGPEGFLLVAAGGRGMASTWFFFPHLAWAITEKVRS